MNPVQVYECLCDSSRLRILNLLKQGPLCACHLETILGASDEDVSRQLALLCENGMVETGRQGEWTVYHLPAMPHPLLEENLKCLQDLTGEWEVFRQDLATMRGIDRSAICAPELDERAVEKPTVLILCTGNSCRSHMAEGILRQLADDIFEVRSAGSDPAGYVHPHAVAVLAEIGIDIGHHVSKPLSEFLNQNVETVITVCGNASQACPVFPGQINRYHWEFFDPAKAEGSEDELNQVFRDVRDRIKTVFEAYVAGYREKLAGCSAPQ